VVICGADLVTFMVKTQRFTTNVAHRFAPSKIDAAQNENARDLGPLAFHYEDPAVQSAVVSSG
jgi:hypothetical protein